LQAKRDEATAGADEVGDPARDALTKLARLLRRDGPSTSTADFVMSIEIPDDLAREDAQAVTLDLEEVAAFKAAQETLEGDLRFEYLTHRPVAPLRGHIERFVCLCAVSREGDHVEEFFAEHAQTPRERHCFLPVEFLTVEGPTEVFGLRLLPVGHADVPAATGWFDLDPPVGAVAVVASVGTHLGLMKDRAATIADGRLRLLRVALRENRWINSLQLRFRLSEGYSFGDHGGGWQTGPDARWDLTLDRELLAVVTSQPLAALAGEPRNRLERNAARALSWIEEAMLTVDPLTALLLRFFSLESLLGTRSEKRKAHGLAFRRALLGAAATGRFADPFRALRLYDQVRSAAVHGDDPPPVPEDVQRAFAWDVRSALNEYLQLAKREGLQTRRAMIRYLNRHPDRDRLSRWLIETNEDEWSGYFDGADQPV
jgi:hypothetical protein